MSDDYDDVEVSIRHIIRWCVYRDRAVNLMISQANRTGADTTPLFQEHARLNSLVEDLKDLLEEVVYV